MLSMSVPVSCLFFMLPTHVVSGDMSDINRCLMSVVKIWLRYDLSKEYNHIFNVHVYDKPYPVISQSLKTFQEWCINLGTIPHFPL